MRREGRAKYPPTSSSLRKANLFLMRHTGIRRAVGLSAASTEAAGSDGSGPAAPGPTNQSRTCARGGGGGLERKSSRRQSGL